VEPLIELLKDEDQGVRWSAASALGRLCDKRALTPLLESLKDGNHWVRANATAAIGGMGDVSSFDAVLRRLTDREADVRWFAVKALAELGDLQALPKLLEIMKDDEEPWVRSKAYESIYSLLGLNAKEPEPENDSSDSRNVTGPWDEE
jgi:HEAT repeat protein